MPSPAGWRRDTRPASFNAENRRWTVIVIVLIGSLGVYGVERWMRKPDAPIAGNAYVADGDTLTISGVRIRLLNIDAPELEQICSDNSAREWPCGRQASSQLRALVRGHNLTCQPRSHDKYGRMLAICFLPDKTNVNAWMVQHGWAIAYDYANTYGSLQAEAKAAKRGLWSGTFMQPHEWRQTHPRLSEDERKD